MPAEDWVFLIGAPSHANPPAEALICFYIVKREEVLGADFKKKKKKEAVYQMLPEGG